MQSAIYEGQLRHRRMQPAQHAFRYRLFMMYLDLSELESVFRGRWLWSCRRTAVARFRRDDHFGDPAVGLDRAVRDLVGRQTGIRPTGPVRLLTHLRYFGHCFNPVSFYYCFDDAGDAVENIVAEVNNTPWKERHCYVLDPSQDCGDGVLHRYCPVKSMHVSPFMPMDVDYDWRFSPPGEQLAVHMENHRKGSKVFDATLRLERSEVSGRSLARVLTTYAPMTLRVIWGIHWQALKLWMKRVPVYDHPSKAMSVRERKT